MKAFKKVRDPVASRNARQRRGPASIRGVAPVLLLFLGAAAHADDAWRVAALYGQAVGPTSQGFAEFGALAAVREWRLGRHFSLAAELNPVIVFNLTRVDLSERPRDIVYALAASPLLSYSFSEEAARVRIRLEAGAGPFWAESHVPAKGTCFNFLTQAGASLVFRLDSGSWISAGLRWVHVSNAYLVSEHNPGLTFWSAAVSYSWPARKGTDREDPFRP